MAYGIRGTTKDIDALYAPKSRINEIALQMADEFGLPSDWLNDSAKGFVVADTVETEPVASFGGLVVEATSRRMLLGMKLGSARFEESDDFDDAIALAGQLGISSKDELYDIAERHCYGNQLTARSGMFIEQVARELGIG